MFQFKINFFGLCSEHCRFKGFERGLENNGQLEKLKLLIDYSCQSFYIDILHNRLPMLKYLELNHFLSTNGYQTVHERDFMKNV